MELEQYMERVLDKMKWYDHKAMAARRSHVMLDLLSTLFLMSTPVILMLSYYSFFNRTLILLATVTSVSVMFISTLQRFSRYDSKWQQYRLTAEQLRKELTMFTMKAGEYSKIEDSKQQQEMFIARIENLVSSETSLWWVGERREEDHDAS
jgi:uncharacterized protein DUF4231